MASCAIGCGDARADVDQLGALARVLQQPRGNQMVVDDDVRGAEMR